MNCTDEIIDTIQQVQNRILDGVEKSIENEI